MFFTVGILSAFIFCSIYGMQILNPTYTDWLLESGDLTQHYLGWKAFRSSDWHFPFGLFDTLSAPNQTSIIFTDSIPLFAIFFKLLSPILPANFQYFGLWGILCFILQGVLASYILSNYTKQKYWIIVASLLFVISPIMIFRMYYHSALAAHWIILLGLMPYFTHDRYENNKRIFSIAAAMAFFASSIHTYLVLINGILLAGFCLSDILVCKRLRRSVELLAIYLLIAIICTGLLGGFTPGIQATSGGLGSASFNLNSFFNPLNWSSFFSALPLYKTIQYEGFCYLGLGCLLLVFISFVSVFICKQARQYLKQRIWQFTALIAAMSICILVALSPKITFGNHVLFDFHLPQIIIKCWSVFRASGRIAWGAVYIIMLGSCILIFQFFSRKVMMLLVSLCLAVQAYDIHAVLLQKNQQFSQKIQRVSPLQNETFWNHVATNEAIKRIVFSSSSLNNNTMFTFADWAIEHGKKTNYFYFARSNYIAFLDDKHISLKYPSPSDLFIFEYAEKDDRFQYNLNYYEIDGFIVGYVNEIEGFPYMPAPDFHYSWTLSNEAQDGIDIEAGKQLNPGKSYRTPERKLLSGYYQLLISGHNLLDSTDIIICSDAGNYYHNYIIEQESDTEVQIELPVDFDIKDLEIQINNTGKETIVLKKIELTCIE